jgi:hypothetical protein
MLSNRHLEVKVAKNSDIDEEPDTRLADLAYIAQQTSNSMFKGVGALILTYMAADTVRQIAILSAKAKLQGTP